MEIALPRMSRNAASEARVRSSPANRMDPPAMRPGGEGISPMTASADLTEAPATKIAEISALDDVPPMDEIATMSFPQASTRIR